MTKEDKVFKRGDIVVLEEVGNRVGPHDFSFQSKELAEKQKARYRKQRWEVIRILEHRYDADGNNCLQLRRLDLKSWRVEIWSPSLMRKV